MVIILDTVSLVHSDYIVTAEFHDLLTDEHSAAIRETLPKALAGADPTAGPVIDIGAGTGLVTEAIADLLPAAKIVAVEPDPVMRAALVTRLTCRPGLRDRVSIRAAGILAAELPERFGGVTAFGMLGHLNQQERATLWRLLAQRLAPGCPAVIHVLPPHEVEAVPMTLGMTTHLGDDRIEGWMAADVTGPETLHWTMTYRVLQNDAVQREAVAEFDWHPLLPVTVAEEAATAGLSCATAADDVLVLTAGRSTTS
jgi:SAM-dependent methyltransferase